MSDRDRRERPVLVGHMQHSQETGAPKRGSRCPGASIGSRIAVFAQMGEHYDGKARVMQFAQKLGSSPIGEMSRRAGNPPLHHRRVGAGS